MCLWKPFDADNNVESLFREMLQLSLTNTKCMGPSAARKEDGRGIQMTLSKASRNLCKGRLPSETSPVYSQHC